MPFAISTHNNRWESVMHISDMLVNTLLGDDAASFASLSWCFALFLNYSRLSFLCLLQNFKHNTLVSIHPSVLRSYPTVVPKSQLLLKHTYIHTRTFSLLLLFLFLFSCPCCVYLLPLSPAQYQPNIPTRFPLIGQRYTLAQVLLVQHAPSRIPLKIHLPILTHSLPH